MINTLRVVLFSLSLALLLSACGGGGSTNHAPVLSAISNVNMVAGNSLIISLTATDQDIDAISFSTSGGSALTVSATVSGNSLTITPAPGYVTASPIPFTATANDGKGGTDAKTFSISVAASTKVVVKLATSGMLPQGSSIGAIDATVAYSTNKGLAITAENVVTSDKALNSIMLPNVATIGEVKLGNITGSGFGVGEFATLTFSILAGNHPSSNDFSVKSGIITDFNTIQTISDVSVKILSVTFM